VDYFSASYAKVIKRVKVGINMHVYHDDKIAGNCCILTTKLFSAWNDAPGLILFAGDTSGTSYTFKSMLFG